MNIMSENNRIASLRLWTDQDYRDSQVAAALRRWQDPDYKAAQKAAHNRLKRIHLEDAEKLLKKFGCRDLESLDRLTASDLQDLVKCLEKIREA
jgi:hypothetical protein